MNSFPMITGFDAPRVVNVPNRGLGKSAKSWSGQSTDVPSLNQYFAVFQDWHGP
jgi:hypothetical protein